jgi:hypothetical protein
MDKVEIPQDIDSASRRLNGIDALLTASKWERAAIVFAFTGDDTPGPKVVRGESTAISCREFAARGITGLRSDATVRRYRRAWQWAVNARYALPVTPGATAELPKADWEDVPSPEPTTRPKVTMTPNTGEWDEMLERRKTEGRGSRQAQREEEEPHSAAGRMITEANDALTRLATHQAAWQFATDEEIAMLREIPAKARTILADMKTARRGKAA